MNPQSELGPVMVPQGVIAAQCRKAIRELQLAEQRLKQCERRAADEAIARARAILGNVHG